MAEKQTSAVVHERDGSYLEADTTPPNQSLREQSVLALVGLALSLTTNSADSATAEQARLPTVGPQGSQTVPYASSRGEL